MNPEADKVSYYYNTSSKRSFFFSRLAIIGSMGVLLIALLINVYLNSQTNPQTLQSQAANDSANTATLPSLPPGCEYQKLGNGFTVVCQTLVPTSVDVQK